MDIRVSVSQFSKILGSIQGISNRKNIKPVLSHVYLEATENNTLKVIATDQDITLITELSVDTDTPGSIIVPAKSLFQMIRVLPGPDVSIHTLENNHIEIKSGRTKARLVGLSAEEFPPITNIDDVSFNQIHADLFTEMVDKSIYAASVDETRYNLNGVMLESEEAENGNHLVMVATDGHRLVRIERNFKEFNPEAIKADEKNSLILPRKGLSELRHLFDHPNVQKNQDGSDLLDIGFTGNHLVLRYHKNTLIMRLIDGVYPDYREVIPKVSDKIVRVSKNTLIQALKRVNVLAADKMQPVKLMISDSKIDISCKNPDTGEIKDDVPAEYTGEDIEIAFNARYLIESLASVNEHNVMLKLTNSISPGVLSGIEDGRHICVVMPMRT